MLTDMLSVITVSPPQVTYETAAQARINAEATGDEYLYELAASLFDEIGMPTSAQRMRDRAAHYRSIA